MLSIHVNIIKDMMHNTQHEAENDFMHKCLCVSLCVTCGWLINKTIFRIIPDIWWLHFLDMFEMKDVFIEKEALLHPVFLKISSWLSQY